MIRVAVIGNHAHPFCSEVHWARAFEENGCDVVRLQVDDVVRNPDAAMRVLRNVQLVSYTRTHAPGRYLEESWTARWRVLEAYGVRTVSLHLDRYFDLEREHLVPSDAQFTTEHVGTADGGSHDRFVGAGVEGHFWFRPGVDRHEASQPGVLRAEWADKVVFAGSGGTYHGEYPQRAELLAFLRARYGDRFVHVGHGGDRPVVRQQPLNDLYRSAAVVVGDSCFANAPDWRTKTVRYVSDRYYESVGRGAFLLAPRLPNMEADFGLTSGLHLATYEPGDWDDLAATCDYYLGAPDARATIARAGQQHVIGNHTYTARIAGVLAQVGLAPVEAA